MTRVDQLVLRSRIDEFSYQVSADNDPRLWFRLERQTNQDVITDFSVGSVPEEQAAGLLLACYQHLGLRPPARVVFRNIVRGSQAAAELDGVQHHLAVSGKLALRRLGASKVDDSLLQSGGKYDLVLQAGPA